MTKYTKTQIKQIAKETKAHAKKIMERGIKNFPGEEDMIEMFEQDYEITLAVVKEFEEGATPEEVGDMLWSMDTAARDEVHQSLWDYVEDGAAEEEAVNDMLATLEMTVDDFADENDLDQKTVREAIKQFALGYGVKVK